MAIFSIPDVRIVGISACVPQNEISNEDYHWISKKERELLIKTTGVNTRRKAPVGMTTSDLCFEATEKLIKDLKWDKDSIDILIFVSQSRDYMVPQTSGILQDRLKLSKKCMAFDVSMGCSAYVYGLSTLNSLVHSGRIKRGLLLMGDTSTYGSYRDKSTYPLFGDAGTTTAVEYSEGYQKTFFNLETDGSGYKAIMAKSGGARHFPKRKDLEYKKYGKGIYRNDLQISLDGIKVFNFSLREVTPNIKQTLSFANINIEAIDYFILHQANLLINNTIRKLLKVDPDKWPNSITKYGNTSSASIPITIVSELREIAQKQKLKLMLSGFGVGLSWGSVIVETDKIVCPEVLEL